MGEDSGGLNMTFDRAWKIAVVLLAIGGGIARYEYMQNRTNERLTSIERYIESRDDLLRRATAVIEKAEQEHASPRGMNGVVSGASSRRGR